MAPALRIPHFPSYVTSCATMLVARSSVNSDLAMNTKCLMTTWSVWQMLLMLPLVECLTCLCLVMFVEVQT